MTHKKNENQLATSRTKKIKTFTLLFHVFLLMSITSFAQHNIKSETLRMEPSNAMGGTASEIIKSITYIPLESGKQSAFGSIDQLEVTDRHFIVLDKQTNTILIFNKEGKFHSKIPGKSISNNQEFAINFYYLDKNRNEIQIPLGRTIYCFNVDGKLVSK